MFTAGQEHNSISEDGYFRLLSMEQGAPTG